VLLFVASEVSPQLVGQLQCTPHGW